MAFPSAWCLPLKTRHRGELWHRPCERRGHHRPSGGPVVPARRARPGRPGSAPVQHPVGLDPWI